MLDDKKLMRLASNETVLALFAHLSNRKNNANVTTADTVETLKKADGLPIRRDEAVKALQELEEAGCGRFVAGRRKKPTRLEWAVSALETARRGLSFSNGSVVEHASPNGSASGHSEIVERFEFNFPLRRGMEVRIELPTNLTADERQRLSMAISTLPAT